MAESISSSPQATGNGQRKRRARPWHRILGLLAALPLLWVVLTGAVLNHTVDWKLDQIMVHQPWLLRAYGMVPKGDPVGIEVSGRSVAEWDGLIFLDAHVVEVPGHLLGALVDEEGVAVVTSSHVWRMHESGEVLEVLDELSLPELPLTGVHESEGSMYLQNADGWHQVEMDWLEFAKVEASFSKQALQGISGEEVDALRVAWAQGGLPLSRVLLDAHAGHFLGSFSKYFYDLVAVVTVWLTVTGLILFFRKPRRNRQP